MFWLLFLKGKSDVLFFYKKGWTTLWAIFFDLANLIRTRVTRLGEFSPVGRMFFGGIF
jgi:hypothetical protein